jgi:tRNA dimethylallyltransferase
VGKTELALRWAERHNAEIVSCDSLLFYRGLDIGTAKPTRAELGRVSHHLIDICGVGERMDIAEYVRRARLAVTEIHGRGRAVLVVGGSGFYLQAFFGPVTDTVEVSPELRLRVAEMPLTEAVVELQRLNPEGLGGLDVENPRRVQRALERCLASGRTLAELAKDFAGLPGPFAGYDVRLVRLDRTPDDLARRIEARVTAMLRDGLVGEVTRLRPLGLDASPSAARAIGYREVIAMLDGALPESVLGATIVRNTRALVKKQRTWFRTQLPEHRLIAAAELKDVAELFPSGD